MRSMVEGYSGQSFGYDLLHYYLQFGLYLQCRETQGLDAMLLKVGIAHRIARWAVSRFM